MVSDPPPPNGLQPHDEVSNRHCHPAGRDVGHLLISYGVKSSWKSFLEIPPPHESQFRQTRPQAPRASKYSRQTPPGPFSRALLGVCQDTSDCKTYSNASSPGGEAYGHSLLTISPRWLQNLEPQRCVHHVHAVSPRPLCHDEPSQAPYHPTSRPAGRTQQAAGQDMQEASPSLL